RPSRPLADGPSSVAVGSSPTTPESPNAPSWSSSTASSRPSQRARVRPTRKRWSPSPPASSATSASSKASTDRGPVGPSLRQQDSWVYRPAPESYGVHRQLQLDSHDPENVVVELQCPVREAGASCN